MPEDPELSKALARARKKFAQLDADGIVLATPTDTHASLTIQALEKGMHVLVEKPLWGTNEAELAEIETLAHKAGVLIYTAYNHRFEPSFIKMKKLLESEALGELYTCRIFYGNGTARLVRESVWKDKGGGVLFDLGSHLLDSVKYWFGNIKGKLELISMNNS